jgi:hypothetical protein
MKDRIDYDVVDGGTRILDNFRGDKVTGKVYRVLKIPEFGNPSEYEVIHSTFGNTCTCQGYMRHNRCKHLKMVEEYLSK